MRSPRESQYRQEKRGEDKRGEERRSKARGQLRRGQVWETLITEIEEMHKGDLEGEANRVWKRATKVVN